MMINLYKLICIAQRVHNITTGRQRIEGIINSEEETIKRVLESFTFLIVRSLI